MNCPRHAVALVPDRAGRHEVDRCPACAGIWVRGGAIDALLGAGEKLKLRSLCSARQSRVACPQDGKALGEALIAGVRLDFCLTCHGLWLDAGELERLQERVLLRPQSTMEGARMVEPELDLSSLDLLVTISEGVLSLLSW